MHNDQHPCTPRRSALRPDSGTPRANRRVSAVETPPETPPPRRVARRECSSSALMPDFGTPRANRRVSAVETPPLRRVATVEVTPPRDELHCSSPICPPAPPVPWKAREREIDEALTWNSVPLLHMALQTSNSSCEDDVIFEAARSLDFEAVKFLLQNRQGGVDVHSKGKRPLHLALQCCLSVGDIGYRIAELLLQHGAMPNHISGDDPLADSPLIEATKRCSVAAVALLLSFKADPNVPDPAGSSPLHLACRQERLMFFTPSFSSATFPQLRSTGLHTPDPHAEAVSEPLMGVSKLVEALLREGGSPLQQDMVGNLPIQYIPRGSTRLVSKLRRAEMHWNKQGWLVVQGCGCASAEAKWRRIALYHLMQDTIDAILEFL